MLYYYRAQLKRVIDGDTIVADIDLGLRIWAHDQKIRLLDIDTPERGDEPGFSKAKKYVEAVLGQVDNIYVRAKKIDSFGRWLAYVWYYKNEDDDEPELLNDELLSKGLAKHYER